MANSKPMRPKKDEKYEIEKINEINKMRVQIGMKPLTFMWRKCLRCGTKFKAQIGGANFLCGCIQEK